MIPFIDLMEQYRRLKSEIGSGIQQVLEHGKYIMGPEVYELENRLADYVGVRHVISCSSGTDALLMPLMAWNIGKGDAVFTSTFTFIATAEVVSLLGATPVFIDIDPGTWNIDPNSLEEKIRQTIAEGKLIPKVVIPVDIFGLPADYEAIESIAAKYGIKVLEDAAQSFGGIYKGKKTGSFGNAAGTSFFPAKPLGCYGDGGAVLTDDDKLAGELRSIRAHGQGGDKYNNIRTGINGRLDTIQAAVLLAKLNVFDMELLRRNEIADKYTRGLRGVVKTQTIPDGCSSSWAQYSIAVGSYDEREYIREKLTVCEIPTGIYYPRPLHLQEAFSYLGYSEGDFVVAEDVSKRIMSVPMHPYLPDETIEKIIEIIEISI
ncbi:MAG TPA: DegT/DnrJ/EryC1/StrS family aminotransferase [Clostridiales bacterium]|nr:DegT/DnrJ/EryC1/StrS family aminotransferase [Clostridiales bacterium]